MTAKSNTVCCIQEIYLKKKKTEGEQRYKKQGLLSWYLTRQCSDIKALKEKEHFMILKAIIHNENIAVINVYICNHIAMKFIKTKQVESIDKNIPVIGGFNTFLSKINQVDKNSIQKI